MATSHFPKKKYLVIFVHNKNEIVTIAKLLTFEIAADIF